MYNCTFYSPQANEGNELTCMEVHPFLKLSQIGLFTSFKSFKLLMLTHVVFFCFDMGRLPLHVSRVVLNVLKFFFKFALEGSRLCAGLRLKMELVGGGRGCED